MYLPDPDDLEEGGGAEGVAAALGLCDVACFLYDASDSLSFSSAASLYVSLLTFLSLSLSLLLCYCIQRNPRIKDKEFCPL